MNDHDWTTPHHEPPTPHEVTSTSPMKSNNPFGSHPEPCRSYTETWRERFRKEFGREGANGRTWNVNPDGSYSDVWFGPDELEAFIAAERTRILDEVEAAVPDIVTGEMNGWSLGWNDMRAEILTRIAALRGGGGKETQI